MRLKWDGSFEVYRVVARGVRLRGRLVHGKVSWGQIDKLLPPPTQQAVRAARISCSTSPTAASRWRRRSARLGLRWQGNGKLSGGFTGRRASSARSWSRAAARPTNLHAHLAVAVVARRPQIDGPVTLERFTCPASQFDVAAPRFDAQGELQRGVHQRRRQRADGDPDARSPAPTASPISSATSLSRARSTTCRGG